MANLLIETNDTGIQSIKTRKNIFTADNNGIINIKYKDFKKDNYIRTSAKTISDKYVSC